MTADIHYLNKTFVECILCKSREWHESINDVEEHYGEVAIENKCVFICPECFDKMGNDKNYFVNAMNLHNNLNNEE